MRARPKPTMDFKLCPGGPLAHGSAGLVLCRFVNHAEGGISSALNRRGRRRRAPGCVSECSLRQSRASACRHCRVLCQKPSPHRCADAHGAHPAWHQRLCVDNRTRAIAAVENRLKINQHAPSRGETYQKCTAALLDFQKSETATWALFMCCKAGDMNTERHGGRERENQIAKQQQTKIWGQFKRERDVQATSPSDLWSKAPGKPSNHLKPTTLKTEILRHKAKQ